MEHEIIWNRAVDEILVGSDLGSQNPDSSRSDPRMREGTPETGTVTPIFSSSSVKFPISGFRSEDRKSKLLKETVESWVDDVST